MALPSRYDPARIFVTFGGLPIRGYAPGTFINIRRDSPNWKNVRGTNSELRRLKQKNRGGTVDLTLRHSSPVNQVLGGLVVTDEITSAIIAPLVIADLLNLSGAATVDAYISGYPDLVYSQGEPNLTWTFICERIDMAYPGLSPEVVAGAISGIIS